MLVSLLNNSDSASSVKFLRNAFLLSVGLQDSHYSQILTDQVATTVPYVAPQALVPKPAESIG